MTTFDGEEDLSNSGVNYEGNYENVKVNKYERKAKATILQCGLEPVTGIKEVTIKRNPKVNII